MKKNIPVRILTALGGLTLLALAAGVVAEGFFAVPVLAAVGGVLASGSALAVAGKILLALIQGVLAVAAIVCAQPSRPPRQAGSILQKGENGTFGITVGAIRKMVLACCGKHTEITHADVDIREVREGIVILLNVEQVGGVSIPLSIARLQKQVRQYVNGRTGLDVVEVRVMVDNQSDEHVASEFEVEDLVVPSAAQKGQTPRGGAAEEAPLVGQLRQIAEITRQNPSEAVTEPETVPMTPGMPILPEEDDELDRRLQAENAVSGAAEIPVIVDEAEKPLHQRVFGAEELPLTVPVPPEMAQANLEAAPAPAEEVPQEPAPAVPAPVEEAAEDWTAPSLQAAAEEVLSGDLSAPEEDACDVDVAGQVPDEEPVDADVPAEEDADAGVPAEEAGEACGEKEEIPPVMM